MSDRHPIYVGHFVHDGKFVECDIEAETRLARPRMARKLTSDELDQLPSIAHISPDERETILKTGYVVVDLVGCRLADLEVVTDLVNRDSCDLVDRTFRVVPLNELGHC